jgi:methyl-accepting chemotaxis protein
MASFMAAAKQGASSTDKSAPQNAGKPPRDAVDEEALRTGRPVGRFVDGAYRYSLPIVLGVTSGTDQPSCFACHGATMNLAKGQVLSVFSSSLSTTAEFAALRQLLMEMAGASVVGTVILVLIIRVIFARVISRRLVGMTAAMRRLAGGDLVAEIPATDRNDEVGQMAQAMLVFRQNAQEARALQAAADQAHVLKERRQAAMDRHTQDFGTSAAGVMANLARSAETMRAVASQMQTAAQSARDGAARTAEGATVSAQNLAAVAAAAEQMSASIREISQQVARATQAAHTAVERASDTDIKVAGMAELATRIGDVVRLISDVAGRTNLLALNATIEAARAGDAGKGFAVVASEVKALATQTAKATDEISSQIAAIRAATADAVSAVREVGTAIGQVEEVATAIAGAVEEQASVTQDIVTSVHNVTAATQEATKAMQEVSTASEHTDAASGKVLEGADAVGRDSDTMRNEVTEFLKAMASTSEEDRRRYERVAGNAAQAVLRVPGRAAQRVAINDISRGGVSLRSDWSADAGTEVQVELPGADGSVGARTVRSARGELALAFRQDAAVLQRVDQALTHIGALGGRAAA